MIYLPNIEIETSLIMHLIRFFGLDENKKQLSYDDKMSISLLGIEYMMFNIKQV